jgi:hypothetical protein
MNQYFLHNHRQKNNIRNYVIFFLKKQNISFSLNIYEHI